MLKVNATALLALSAAASVAWSGALCAQDAEPKLPDLKPIMEEVARIRGLEFKRDVPAEVQSADDFKVYLLRDMDRSMPDNFDEVVKGLVRLGMLGEEIDLGEAMVDAILSQAGAYYDPETGKFFYLMTDMPEMIIRIIAAHELVHALQDQHFDLKRTTELLIEEYAGDGPRNDDYVQAVRFLIEGEATYIMNIVGAGGDEEFANMATRVTGEMNLETLVEMSKQQPMGADLEDAMKAMDEIPPYILEPLIAAYMQGGLFCMEVRVAGGWEALNKVWSDMPISTELTLHPEKYIGAHRDMPTELNLPDFSAFADNGWTRIDAAIHGESMLSLLLREQGVESEPAEIAVAGWDGDMYQAWRNGEGEIAIVLATTWDSENDATEFYGAYRKAIESKYPHMHRVRETESPQGPLTIYACSEENESLGEGMLLRRGKEVFAVEGTSADVAEAVLEDLKELDIEYVDTVEVEPLADAAKEGEGGDEVAGDDDGDDLAEAEDRDRVYFESFSCVVDPKWKQEQPDGQGRVAQFLIPAAEGDEDETRLIVYNFSDRHGGGEEMVEANMERWIDQFTSDATMKRAELAAGGMDIHHIDITGHYQAETFPGSGERHDEPGYRMLAAIVLAADGTYYFKIVGAEATVTQSKDAWQRTLESIEPAM